MKIDEIVRAVGRGLTPSDYDRVMPIARATIRMLGLSVDDETGDITGTVTFSAPAKVKEWEPPGGLKRAPYHPGRRRRK